MKQPSDANKKKNTAINVKYAVTASQVKLHTNKKQFYVAKCDYYSYYSSESPN